MSLKFGHIVQDPNGRKLVVLAPPTLSSNAVLCADERGSTHLLPTNQVRRVPAASENVVSALADIKYYAEDINSTLLRASENVVGGRPVASSDLTRMANARQYAQNIVSRCEHLM